MTTEAAAADAKDGKKKKRVVVTPPCPPGVSTGYLLLRGAVGAVVGVSMLETSCSVMQPTFLKEKPVLSGKFSLSVGKKLGVGELELPEDDEARDELLTGIEKEANRCIQNGVAFSAVTTTKEAAESLLGSTVATKPPLGVFNQMHMKTKPEDAVTLAHVDQWVLAIPPSLPYATAAALDKIVVERGNQNSDIACGKKSRKDAQITIKFHVTLKQPDAPVVEASTDNTIAETSTQILCQNKVRSPEGQRLVQAAAAQQQKAQEAATKETTTPTEEETPKDEEMVVNAWEVKGKIDYTKLVKEFGSQLLTEELLQKLQDVAKGRVPRLHRFLRRNMFFSHRDLHTLLDQMQQHDGTVYLYTGRGPSSDSMHLGHLIPFLFTRWLQQAFDCPLVIQMTDDEKFLFKGVYDEQDGDNLNHFANLTIENARDIIACGFDYDKTFLFSDLDYVGRMYPNIVRIWKAVTTNTVNGIFGFDGSSNIGKIAFPAIQAAPSFASSFPTVLQADHTSKRMCLIPCAIDQDPYFRMTRDVAHKLVAKPKSNEKPHGLNGKPALIHSKFFPPLQGATGKMSSSDTNSAIFLTDTPEEIERKIKEHAFSGGRETKKEQEELGANLEIDVSYQWLRFFLEDDELLDKIGKDYGSGSGEYWSTNKVKAKLIEVLQELVAEHQQRRAKITDEEVRKWMTERSLVG
ncbi:Tryptophan--tRNA ligase, cytoplasmic [Seminavis robusta]|uniref:Tryptophan--tRNA ligase, cytoplasmic n=1 Tax=Seminavis robusta TaxID=568900 RepID=A0A9N8DIJ4_9STRA|nr:Tryptophan--tRNA ligase, cytoplasmic [Seminavis robusta]|eukprot:Sro177_g077620.1 Tryptophan--tRNA ligase, cytoplasmic (689) ;mRNA; f:14182-16248